MKKLIQIITAAVVSVAFIGTAVGAQTPPVCDDIIIVNTGDDNDVEVNCETITNITITCSNNVATANINYQNGQSGSATVTGNGSNYTTSTGDVINTNNSAVTIDASCNGASVTPSPSPSVSPSPSATPKPSVKPAALPNTAGASAESVVVASIVAAALVVIASRVIVAAYRRSTK